jgi:hypothetical protein
MNPVLLSFRRVFLAAVTFSTLMTGVARGQNGASYASDAEFTVLADFDGDGRTDVALIDRRSGAVRVAYQTSPGGHAWHATRSIGLHSLSGASAGRLLALGHDGLVVTAPDANRLLLVDLPATATPALPQELFVAGIGPTYPAAVNLPGPGNTGFDDLVTASMLNGAKPQRIARTRNQDGATFSPLDETTPEPRLLGLQRLSRAASIPGYTVTYREGTQARVEVYNASAAPVSLAWNITNLPPSGNHLIATFTDGANRHLISWEPGQAGIGYARLVNGVVSVNAQEAATMQVDSPEHLRLIEQPGGPPLILATSLTPGGATLLRFDGTNTWTSVATFAAPESGSFSTAAGLADGSFLLMAGTDGRSTLFQRVARQGTDWIPGPWGALPSLPGAPAGGNVLEFASEPFVTPNPGLVRTRNVPDWTSSFSIAGGPPVLTVVAESFLGGAAGLDSPVPSALGAPHAQTQFGLVNQVHAAISLYAFSPAYGDVVSEVSIRPAPGRYKTGIAFAFQLANPLHAVRYRLNDAGDWILFTGSPVPLTEDTTISYYAHPPLGTSRSAIQTVRYEFTRPPATLDSNADGLPDFVALGKKLDPHSDGDSDDDGVSDLRELLSDTDPLDATSKPGTDALQAPAAGRTFTLRPRPIDALSGELTLARTGAPVRLYQLSGGLLGAGAVSHLSGPSGSNAARISGLPVDPRLPLLIAATDPHFDIETVASDPSAGRELIRLLSPPPASPVGVSYAYGSAGGTPLAEANAWIAAARAAAGPVLQPPAPPTELTPLDAMAARLAEAWVAGALWARGHSEASNLTLFPFRANDAGRWSPPHPLLQSLYQSAPSTAPVPPPPPTGPPWVPNPAVLAGSSLALPTFLPGTDPARATLRDLAESIYQLSARSNTVLPGRYDPPFDVLRQFVWTGSVPNAYLEDLNVPADQWTTAQTAVLDALSGVPVRAATNVIVRLRNDSWEGPCTLVDPAVGPPEPIALFDANGTAYKLPESFDLPAGTLLAVEAFPTAPSPACGGFAGLEVVSAQVTSLPEVPLVDLNGNLLPDDWERLFLGGLAEGPFSDTDQDGYPDAQEMQEGSDPMDPMNQPPVAPLELGEPELEISLSPLGEIEVHWNHAPGFAKPAGPAWQFALLGSPSLNGPFTLLASRPAESDGQIRLPLPAPADAVRFFRLQVQLVRR